MKALRKSVAVAVGLAIALWVFHNRSGAQTAREAPAVSDPNLLAAIFMPSRTVLPADEPIPLPSSELKASRHEIHLSLRKPPIPEDWEAFEKHYGPPDYPERPTVRLMEKGMYQVNQIMYSVKLFERNVNSLLSLEWSLHELSGYDPRSKANALDNFFDHAKVKTEFNWDAPIGLYVGIRFQIRCDSIFQFWK